MSNATAELIREIRIHDYLHVLGICISLMYWDHLITLDTEIGFLWKRARSTSAYWFFAVRYAGFAGNIPVTIFTFFTMAPRWCHAYHMAHQVVLAGTQLIVSIVMMLRIHALYGRNLRLLAWLLALSTPILIVIAWSMVGQESDPVDILPGCHVSVSKSTAYHLAAAWEALFVYDAGIFGLTVYKTYSMWRREGSPTDLPIHTLILRDGALYFAAITLANFCNIVTFYISGPILAGSLSTFASCMSVAMMSRLMLNLHEKAHVGVFTHLTLSFVDDVLLGVAEPGDNQSRPLTGSPDIPAASRWRDQE